MVKPKTQSEMWNERLFEAMFGNLFPPENGEINVRIVPGEPGYWSPPAPRLEGSGGDYPRGQEVEGPSVRTNKDRLV